MSVLVNIGTRAVIWPRVGIDSGARMLVSGKG
jgi:hypothetical protein